MTKGKLGIRWRRFAAIAILLAVVDAVLLVLYFHDRLGWTWVMVLDWPARFLVPREEEEMLGPLREGMLVWLASLPWLAVCAAVLSLGRRPRSS